MKLTSNQRDVLAVLAGRDGVVAAEVVARSGRRYVPGVIRVLESLRGDGLASPLNGQAGRRWRITEAGYAALVRHGQVRDSAAGTARAARLARVRVPELVAVFREDAVEQGDCGAGADGVSLLHGVLP
jgi:hypothetical protein